MSLSCIWWWNSSFGDLGSVEYFFAITPSSTLNLLGPPSVGEIDLFKNYLYFIEQFQKKKNFNKTSTPKKSKYEHTMNVIP